MTQTLWRSLNGPQAFTMDSNFQDHEISWGYSVISRSTGIQRVDLCCNVFVRSAGQIQLQFFCLVRSLIKQLWAVIARLRIKIPKSVILGFSFLLSICVWKILFCSLLFQCRCMSIADTYCWQLNSYCLSFLVCSVNIIIFGWLTPSMVLLILLILLKSPVPVSISWQSQIAKINSSPLLFACRGSKPPVAWRRSRARRCQRRLGLGAAPGTAAAGNEAGRGGEDQFVSSVGPLI